jgi:hypothetical protein
MIISHELRLGNLVLAPGLWENQYFNIIELYTEECSVSPDLKNEARIVTYQDIEPIHLTLTLLKSFGFELEEYGLHQLSYYVLLTQHSHQLYLNQDLQPVKSPAHPIPLSNCRIQYFHQLQNLFYCLTGQELSIYTSRR